MNGIHVYRRRRLPRLTPTGFRFLVGVTAVVLGGLTGLYAR